MTTATIDLLAEALFASDLQMSQRPSAHVAREAVTRTLLRHGSDGCTAVMAVEFGDHPDIAVRRMAWARDMITAAYLTDIAAPRFAG